MALLIKTTGVTKEINPSNGTDFQLKELQTYVEGLIELVHLGDGFLMVVNEEGKFYKEHNRKATIFAHTQRAILPTDYICGNVVLCREEEVR